MYYQLSVCGKDKDSDLIVPLLTAFTQDRANLDPTRTLKPNFDFEKYLTSFLSKPLNYCLALEYINDKNPTDKQTVGFMLTHAQDEAPPPDLLAELAQRHNQSRPFQPRRVGTVQAFYIDPQHRNPKAIKTLIEAGIQQAKELCISDIDVQIGADRKKLQSLIERMGFKRVSTRFTLHLDVPTDAELPSLHPPRRDPTSPAKPTPEALPLRDPQTNELILNPQGLPVYLYPALNDQGQPRHTSSGLPIYPPPLRDPQTQAYLFDTQGQLVISPIALDDQGNVIEHQGIPQFHPPAYHHNQGKLTLARTPDGDYRFCGLERDSGGNIRFKPDGKPLFKTIAD